MIYCVEAEQNICELEVYTLQSVGLDAKGCSTGKELFTELENKLPQLILLDIMLPDEDGLNILRRLRSDERYAHIPVIMATAKGTEFDKVKGLEAVRAEELKAKKETAAKELEAEKKQNAEVAKKVAEKKAALAAAKAEEEAAKAAEEAAPAEEAAEAAPAEA